MIGIVYDRELRETGTGLSTKKPDDSLENHQVNLEIYIVTKLKGLGKNQLTHLIQHPVSKGL